MTSKLSKSASARKNSVNAPRTPYHRTTSERAIDLANAKTVLARWKFRQGPTLKQLCAEVGIPYSRFVKFSHWRNELPVGLPEPPLAEMRRARREATKIKPA